MKKMKFVILAGALVALGAGLHYLHDVCAERRMFDDFCNEHGYDDDDCCDDDIADDGDFAD